MQKIANLIQMCLNWWWLNLAVVATCVYVIWMTLVVAGLITWSMILLVITGIIHVWAWCQAK